MTRPLYLQELIYVDYLISIQGPHTCVIPLADSSWLYIWSSNITNSTNIISNSNVYRNPDSNHNSDHSYRTWKRAFWECLSFPSSMCRKRILFDQSSMTGSSATESLSPNNCYFLFIITIFWQADFNDVLLFQRQTFRPSDSLYISTKVLVTQYSPFVGDENVFFLLFSRWIRFLISTDDIEFIHFSVSLNKQEDFSLFRLGVLNGELPLQGQNPLHAMCTDVWWMQLWYSRRHGELYVRLSLPHRKDGLTTGHSTHL